MQNSQSSESISIYVFQEQQQIYQRFLIPYVKENGKFIPYKAEKAEAEIEAAQKAVDLLGGEISDKIEFQLPGGDMGRTLVVIDKIKKTPKKYPRKAGTPAKMPIV